MSKEKRKSIIIYIIILMLFGVFSIFLVTKDKLNSQPENVKPKDKIVESQDENNDNHIETTKDDLGHEYENESKNIVKAFLGAYHEINSTDPSKNFEKAKDIIVEPLYLELQNEVISSNSMQTNDFIYRTIKDIKLYEYVFDDDSKSISLKAKVYSDWLDNNKNIVSKNELTEYNFLLINDMGKWKISQLSSDVI